jgi:hypothetical protein
VCFDEHSDAPASDHANTLAQVFGNSNLLSCPDSSRTEGCLWKEIEMRECVNMAHTHSNTATLYLLSKALVYGTTAVAVKSLSDHASTGVRSWDMASMNIIMSTRRARGTFSSSAFETHSSVGHYQSPEERLVYVCECMCVCVRVSAILSLKRIQRTSTTLQYSCRLREVDTRINNAIL